MSRIYLRLAAVGTLAFSACVLIGLWLGRAIDNALRLGR